MAGGHISAHSAQNHSVVQIQLDVIKLHARKDGIVMSRHNDDEARRSMPVTHVQQRKHAAVASQHVKDVLRLAWYVHPVEW